MAANHHSASNQVQSRRRHEGPKNHYISFVLSILLTILAFFAAANTELDRWFIYAFIVLLAIVQVLVQLGYWMHLKDRGHLFPILGMIGGAVVALTCVIMAVYWLWW